MSKHGSHQTGVGLDHWGDQFPDTQWTVLMEKRPSTTASQEPDGFAALCTQYWYPLYSFLRKKGYPTEDAQDHTQGFLAHLLKGEAIHGVDRTKGRFRSYLLGAMTHYLNDQRKYRNAQKRGGGQAALSIESDLAEGRFQSELVDDLSPEKLFDRNWAVTVLDAAKRRLGQEYAEQGKGKLFAEIGDFVSGPPSSGDYTNIAVRLNQKEDNVRTLVSRLRGRYRTILREQVQATVSSSDEIDGEIQHLLSAFTGS